MSDTPSRLDAVRRPPVLLAILIAVVVVVVWLLAFFLPQGSKVSTLKAKQQTLEEQVAQGNAKVARLKHTFQHAGELKTMDAKLRAYVPTTADIFKTTANYTKLLSAAVAAAHMTLTSASPGNVTLPSSSSTSKFTDIPVTLAVTGTYDNLLALISSIYVLPRLTDIDAVAINGGGPGTTRTSTLTATLSLMAFTTAAPPTHTP